MGLCIRQNKPKTRIVPPMPIRGAFCAVSGVKTPKKSERGGSPAKLRAHKQTGLSAPTHLRPAPATAHRPRQERFKLSQHPLVMCKQLVTFGAVPMTPDGQKSPSTDEMSHTDRRVSLTINPPSTGPSNRSSTSAGAIQVVTAPARCVQSIGYLWCCAIAP